jgi:hypothetical protein
MLCMIGCLPARKHVGCCTDVVLRHRLLCGAQGLGGLPSTGSQALDLLDLNSLGMFGLLSVVLLVPWNSGGVRSM